MWLAGTRAPREHSLYMQEAERTRDESNSQCWVQWSSGPTYTTRVLCPICPELTVKPDCCQPRANSFRAPLTLPPLPTGKALGSAYNLRHQHRAGCSTDKCSVPQADHVGSLQHCGDVFTSAEALQQHAWGRHTHTLWMEVHLDTQNPKPRNSKCAAPKQATIEAAELR